MARPRDWANLETLGKETEKLGAQVVAARLEIADFPFVGIERWRKHLCSFAIFELTEIDGSYEY